jgi:acyl-CoA synthetase (AMP-forming)/AMP-acid ligase II
MTAPQTLSPPFATIPDALAAHAAQRPDSSALSAGDEQLTYGELAELVGVLAARLAGLGVRSGDRVAIFGINSIEWVVSFLATLELGAVAVPLNHRLGRAELAHQLELVRARVVLHDAALSELGARAAGTAVSRTIDRGSDDRHSIWLAPPGPGRKATLTPDAPALISFTSGSTGRPKGALISHRALTAAANAYARVLRTTEADNTLVLVPLFHNTGFCDQVAHMLLVGGSIDLLPEFSKAMARDALIRRPANYLIAVPGILRLLALSSDADRIFRDCRLACYGGAPMPSAWIGELAARWPALGLYNCYGLTEFTSVSHILEPSDLPEHHGSVGRPVPGVEQQIVGADGRSLRAGAPGQLMLAGPSRMSRYWAAPDRTREALRGRWLMTGDVASITADGHLQLLGRASEVINRGGEKISPLQVEAAISLDTSVADVAVLGAPHPIFGERVVAFVTLRDRAELDEPAVRAALHESIADYAIPERFFVLDELPRNAAGKIDRRELRSHAEAELAAVQS